MTLAHVRFCSLDLALHCQKVLRNELNEMNEANLAEDLPLLLVVGLLFETRNCIATGISWSCGGLLRVTTACALING